MAILVNRIPFFQDGRNTLHNTLFVARADQAAIPWKWLNRWAFIPPIDRRPWAHSPLPASDTPGRPADGTCILPQEFRPISLASITSPTSPCCTRFRSMGFNNDRPAVRHHAVRAWLSLIRHPVRRHFRRQPERSFKYTASWRWPIRSACDDQQMDLVRNSSPMAIAGRD